MPRLMIAPKIFGRGHDVAFDPRLFDKFDLSGIGIMGDVVDIDDLAICEGEA